MRSLGMPYIGSKTRYARRIIDAFPKADTFVDLFGGGGAITHAAIKSSKYQRYIFNDINPLVTDALTKAREFDFNRFVTREEFELYKDSNFIISSSWSYASMGSQYQYSPIKETIMHGVWDAYVLHDRRRLDSLIGDDYSIDIPLSYNTHLVDCIMCYCYNKKYDAHILPGKLEASKNAIHDAFNNSGLRRSDFGRYSKCTRSYLSDSYYDYPTREHFNYMDEKLCFNFDYNCYKPDWFGMPGIVAVQNIFPLERYNRIKHFTHDLSLEDVELLNSSYDDVDLSGASFVYCDPPYRDTLNAYNCEFNYSEFVKWLCCVDIPVFVSEYNAPSDDFVSVKSFKSGSILGKSGFSKKPDEKLFIRRDFVDWYNDLMRGD